MSQGQHRTLFGFGRYSEAVRITEILRKETVGGAILVAAALVAIVWANSPWADAYFALRDFRIGYAPWHLELSIGHWASDGLLAIFFFLVGLELKREFVAGDLRKPVTALVPVAAAIGGVVVPALIYVGINWGNPLAMRGWATPTATDIAFAVAVLAIIGSGLPTALRIFLLTLAVVDDLIAIVIIAVFYTTEIQLTPLLIALVPLAVYAFLAQRYRHIFGRHRASAWIILLPIGVVVWALVHASGIHATIAGVVLGFMIPVLRKNTSDNGPGLAEILEHRVRPLSAGVAVPIFAFFAAGVAIGGWEGFSNSLGDTITLGIIAGLVIGKPIGILGTTWLLSRLRGVNLDPTLRWVDLFGVSLLAGIGFTVSLLVAELSFGAGVLNDHAKVGILCASVLAALIGAVVLRSRSRHYKRLAAMEKIDEDADGIPDVYQQRGDS
ncbi:Na+/H+ antiporter NhaA [Salinibacterium sp. dk2585]|uniref:Na+/H+ antiporter NhaA n=1 Tax=unclassified Salinibacterium TaxID=2632331 RepID=UPI0011C2424A|nr:MULTISPECIES: Na+/H+ antiporter NhaA [unclassified Salinibacterium]QEE62444.1 Na+/H+ antiporter NhaA [Salinibacterium sp. dk2585]TXK52673.1 Na+/H+ antiporter NhaA [Salinibacterium sp. dk5596]